MGSINRVPKIYYYRYIFNSFFKIFKIYVAEFSENENILVENDCDAEDEKINILNLRGGRKVQIVVSSE